ncbi:hypothetical protein [uncultured Oxalicibacterium sp.]|uniref:hypothetical protein n=1 Tax=uncultured Oxalicibacterium sp. TaxID=1168540 RepID=UPI0025CEC2DE|nr:hypothetical protein [uncultured Oxalicibacterium sp.]
MSVIDRLQGFFYTEPKRISILGSIIYAVMICLFILGCAGQVFTAVNETFRSMANDFTTLSLAVLFPNWPTWFIPENPAGFVVVIAFALGGASLVAYGNRVDQLLRAY